MTHNLHHHHQLKAKAELKSRIIINRYDYINGISQ